MADSDATRPQAEPVVQTEAATDAAEAMPRTNRLRTVAAWVLAVLAAIAIAASVLALWVHETLLETDQFMEVVSPAVQSDAVQAAAGDYLSDQVIAALDLQTRIENALTTVDDRLTEGLANALDLTEAQVQRLQRVNLLDLTRLAAPIAGGVESRIRDAVDSLMTEPRVAELLLNLTEVAHERTVLLVRNELDQLPNIVVEEGQVRLNLLPIISEVLRSLARQGVEIVGLDVEVPRIASAEDPAAAVQRLAGVLGTELEPGFGQVALMSEERLQELQDLVRMVDLLVWALIIVAIGLSVAAVFTAPSIGSGVIRVAIGGAIGLIVGVLIVQGISDGLADAVAAGSAREAFEAIVTTLVASLQPIAIALAVVGFLAAGAAYIATHRSEPGAVRP